MTAPKLLILGKFNEDFLRSALLEIYLKDKMPGSVEYIVFLDEKHQFEKVEKILPKKAKSKISKLYYSDPTSLSITYKNFDIIVISLSKEESYLKSNRKAMSGLLMHELEHTRQRRKGLETKIEKEGKKELKKSYSKAIKMNYKKEDIEFLFSNVYEACCHVLREIYVNIELINRGLGGYVLEDHQNLYKKKQNPFFYETIKKAKEKNQMQQILKAFLYELNLMAAVIPFTKFAEKGNKKAKNFIKHLQKNFEAPIYEISSDFTEIINYSLDNFSWTPKFRRTFFRKIFKLCIKFMK